MFKSLRFIVPAALVAVLAACSVPFPEQTEDLGLNLSSQRIIMLRPPIGSVMLPAQADAQFEGSISVEASKIEDRITLSSLEIPIELVGDVQIDPEGALDGVEQIELRNFTISFSVSDGANTVEIGNLGLPIVVYLNLATGTGDWEIDAGADMFSLVVLSGAIGQVNNIITGDPAEKFTFSVDVSFTAVGVPDELISISFLIDDGPATFKGKAKVV